MKILLFIVLFGASACFSDTGVLIEPYPQRKLVMMMMVGADAQYSKVAHLPSTAKVYYMYEEERLIEIKIEYNDDLPVHSKNDLPHYIPESIFEGSFHVEQNDEAALRTLVNSEDIDKYTINKQIHAEHTLEESEKDEFDLSYNLKGKSGIFANVEIMTEYDDSDIEYKADHSSSSFLDRFDFDGYQEKMLPVHTNSNNFYTTDITLSAEESETDYLGVDVDKKSILDTNSDIIHTPNSSGLKMSTSIDNEFDVPLPVLKTKSTVITEIDDSETGYTVEPSPFSILDSFDSDEHREEIIPTHTNPSNIDTSDITKSTEEYETEHHVIDIDILHRDSDINHTLSSSRMRVSTSIDSDFELPLPILKTTSTYIRRPSVKDIDTYKEPKATYKISKSADDEYNYPLDFESSSVSRRTSTTLTIKKEQDENSYYDTEDDVDDSEHIIDGEPRFEKSSNEDDDNEDITYGEPKLEISNDDED